jgi:hypothetical protein
MASRSSIEAGRGHVTLGVNDQLTAGLAAAQQTFQNFGKTIAFAGAGIAAAGASITAPFLHGLGVFSAWGSEMTSTMRQTGMGMMEMDELMDGFGNTMDGTATSAETFVAAVRAMDNFVHSAATGSRDANAALQEMGLSLTQIQQMSEPERMMAFADGLNRIADASQRGARLQDVFGRGARGLNIQGGAAGVRERAARQDAVEGQQSDKDRQLAVEYTKALNEMKLAITGVWKELGAAAAPAMRDFFQLITQGVIAVRQFIESNRGMFEMIFRVADVMVTAGTAIGILGGVIYGASFAFSFMSGAVGSLSAFIMTVLSPAFAIAAFTVGILKATVALAAGGFGLLTVASIFSKVAMWAFSGAAAIAAIQTTIATMGVNLLIVSLKILALIAIPLVLAALAAPIALLGYGMYRMMQFTGAAESMTNAVSGAFGGMGDSISDAASATFGVLQSAFRRGDWEMIWETIKVLALIAWTEIKFFALSIWDEWTNAAESVWIDITRGLVDAFEGAWLNIEVFFTSMWGRVKAEAFAGLAQIMRATAETLPAGRLRDAAMETARMFENAGAAAVGNADADAQAAADRAGTAQFLRELNRVWEDFDRMNERDAARDDAANRRQGELNGPQAQLGALEDQAWWADFNQAIDDAWRAVDDAPRRPGGLGSAVGLGGAGLSGFNAQALFGAFGGSRTETDAQRAIRLQQQQIDRMDEQIRQQREIARVAGARWG